MIRLFSAIAVLLILFSAPACSTAPPPSPAAIQGNKVVDALRDLSSMYGRKNYSGFMKLVSDKYPERADFAATIESVFSIYRTVQVKIQFTNMFVTVEERGTTRAAFNWEGNWESPGGNVLKNSGRATFIFDSSDARLISIEGKNPFITQQSASIK